GAVLRLELRLHDRGLAARQDLRWRTRRSGAAAIEQELDEAAAEIGLGLGVHVAHRLRTLGARHCGVALRVDIAGRRRSAGVLHLLGWTRGPEQQRLGPGRHDTDGAHGERRTHMTMHRRTLYWFRRTGSFPLPFSTW